MKFLVIAYPPTIFKEEKYFSYAPYVNEMNIWFKNIDEIAILSTTKYDKPLLMIPFEKNFFKIFKIFEFNFLGFQNKILTILKLPIIIFQLLRACLWADHIHLRCPGNIGLVGCFVQIFFPSKPKTIKYAGNWDSNSKQPLSYRIQKYIISCPFLTRHAKVLVYGKWPNQSKNIIPFFTATYSKNEIISINSKDLSGELKFIYVGALHSSKRPLLSIKVIEELKLRGYQVKLDIYGEGDEKEKIENYILENQLKDDIIIHGNKSKDTVKKAFIEAHFLLFISKSEGWPKVVAEAMFWGCVPITSKVSCVPWMLDYGKRGILVENNIDEIVNHIEKLMEDKAKYTKMSFDAQKWSQQYTLEVFDNEIQKLINETT